MDKYYNNNELNIETFIEKMEQGDSQTKSDQSENMKKKKIKDLTLKELIMNTKKEITTLIHDLTKREFKIETFTKNDRLFYIGIFLLVVCLLLYILSFIFSSDSKKTDYNFNMPKEIKLNSNIKSNNKNTGDDLGKLNSQIRSLENKLSKSTQKSNSLERRIKELSKTKTTSVDKDIKDLKKQIKLLSKSNNSNNMNDISSKFDKLNGKLDNLNGLKKSVKKVKEQVKNMNSRPPISNQENLNINKSSLPQQSELNAQKSNIPGQNFETLPIINSNLNNFESKRNLSVVPMFNNENAPLKPQW